MNDDEKLGAAAGSEAEEPHGPNLTLLYTLVFLALAVAIGLALLIVRPFWLRR